MTYIKRINQFLKHTSWQSKSVTCFDIYILSFTSSYVSQYLHMTNNNEFQSTCYNRCNANTYHLASCNNNSATVAVLSFGYIC